MGKEVSLQKVEAFGQICGRSCKNELLMETLYECLVSPRTICTGAVSSLTFLLRHAKSHG